MDHCVRCDKKISVKSPDPDFCKPCFDFTENPWPQVEALVGLDRVPISAHKQRETQMYGFLSLFHSNLTHAKKRELCEDLKR